MIWLIIHHIMQTFDFTNQTKNLITFVLGTFIHTLIYSYLGSLGAPFLRAFHGFYTYIVASDAIAIAIIYKNFYNNTILREFTDIIDPVANAACSSKCENKPVTVNKPVPVPCSSDDVLQLDNIDNNDDNEGYVTNSALGDSYTTNGVSNAM